MKQLLAIKVQSLTDLITNSSSELFQLHTDKTIDQLREILPTITSGYRDPVLFSITDYRNTMKEIDEKLEALYEQNLSSDEISKKEQEIKDSYPNYWFYSEFIKGWFYDPENVEEVKEIYKDYLCANYSNRIQNELQAEFLLFVIKNKYIKEDAWGLYPDVVNPVAFDQFIASHNLPSVDECAHDYFCYGSVESLDGCILIGSENENSIPYDTFDIINDMFNGTNYHLG